MATDKEKSLHECVLELKEYVQPKDGQEGIPVDFVDYSNQFWRPVRQTETSYVPDLTQGKLQPLEDIDDETKEQLDSW